MWRAFQKILDQLEPKMGKIQSTQSGWGSFAELTCHLQGSTPYGI
jgi:hypothetical protein